jgi:hypothetical protein
MHKTWKCLTCDKSNAEVTLKNLEVQFLKKVFLSRIYNLYPVVTVTKSDND